MGVIPIRGLLGGDAYDGTAYVEPICSNDTLELFKSGLILDRTWYLPKTRA